MSRDPELPLARRRLRVVGGMFVLALAILGLRLGDLELAPRDLRVVLPSGAEVDLRLKPHRRPAPIVSMAEALHREP